MITLDLEDTLKVYGYGIEVLSNEGKVAYLVEKKDLANKNGLIPFYGSLDLENQRNFRELLARKHATATSFSRNEELHAVVRSCFSANAEEIQALFDLLEVA